MIYIDDALADLEAAKTLLKRAHARFEQGKEAFKRAPVPELLQMWVTLDKAHDGLDEARKTLNAEIEHFSKAVIPERFEREGIKTTTVVTAAGNFRITVGQRTSASMLDKDAAMKWLRDNDHGGLIKETVDPKTLASFSTALLEDQGQELPEDLFKVSKAPYTSTTKVKG